MTSLGASSFELSPERMLALALRHRRRLILLPVAFGSAAVGLALLRAPMYTSNMAFIVQAGRSEASRLSGLAAQFGVAVPGQQQGQSPDFFFDLLRSHTLLGEVVDSPFVRVVGGEARQTDMPTMLDADGSTDAERREKAIVRLRERVSGSVGLKTGLVNVSVSARSPDLAQELGQRMVARLIEFNVRSRQARAALERQFIEGRLKEARDSLNAAESRLAAFRQSNRGDARSAPALAAQLDRLDREVSLHSQLFLSLAQSESQSRLETLRSTPDLGVVEPPSLPVFRDPRRAGVQGAIGVLVGLALAMLWALVSEWKSARLRTRS